MIKRIALVIVFLLLMLTVGCDTCRYQDNCYDNDVEFAVFSGIVYTDVLVPIDNEIKYALGSYTNDSMNNYDASTYFADNLIEMQNIQNELNSVKIHDEDYLPILTSLKKMVKYRINMLTHGQEWLETLDENKFGLARSYSDRAHEEDKVYLKLRLEFLETGMNELNGTSDT